HQQLGASRLRHSKMRGKQEDNASRHNRHHRCSYRFHSRSPSFVEPHHEGETICFDNRRYFAAGLLSSSRTCGGNSLMRLIYAAMVHIFSSELNLPFANIPE